MKILVTGGAGYIGSFMVDSLVKRGDDVIVVDSLTRGHKEVINENAKFIQADIRNTEKLNEIFSQNKVNSIIHFAGLISVEESTREPELYNDVNVNGSKNLFSTAIKNGVKNFIFSSTAAVYGNPEIVPIPEDHPKNPTSPYGKSKLETERNLIELRKMDPEISFACLRYFNACGAALDGSLGELHSPETHIIPLAIKAALNDQAFKLFGSDYNTKDGTCVRDYIHVLDLVEAHKLALVKILNTKGEYFYNVGTGIGITNKEVAEMVSKVSGKKLILESHPRRPGDSDQLIANATRIREDLGFSSQYSDLDTIVQSAYKFYTK